MKTIQIYTAIASLAVAISTPVFAANDGKASGPRGGAGMAKGGGGAVHAAGPAVSGQHFAQPRGGGFSNASHFQASQPRTFSQNPGFTRPATTNRAFTNQAARPSFNTAQHTNFNRGTVTPRTNNVNVTQNTAAVNAARFRSQQNVAQVNNNARFNAQNNARFNGQNTARWNAQNNARFNQSNRYGGRWYAANTHPYWNHNQAYYWNRHNYRWYNGGWLIVDTGFWPYSYPNPYPYYGYGYDDGYTAQPAYVGSYEGGSATQDVQTELAREGYYYGDIDGDAGPQTRQAIANYQRDHGLYVTGRVDNALLDSLGLD